MLKYYNQYNNCLVYKIFNANKPDTVITDFDESLEIIRKVNKMTGGIKQIVYLIGWQYDGHDSKYPAFFEVNKRLKRATDGSALESLEWLMDEALKYNAFISLHIDMCIAFENSPLYDDYVANDLLAKDQAGNLIDAGVWGGEQSYLVSKTQEWNKGFAQKRIDRLLSMIPKLKRAASIHCDVFMPVESPFHGISRDDDIEAMKQILTYWNINGLDVTTEWFHFELAGFVPMAWHFSLSEGSRLEYPSELICGGGPAWNARLRKPRYGGMGDHYFTRPEEGCLYEEAWGYSLDQDFTKDFEDYFKRNFYLATLSWCFLNTKTAVRHIHTKDEYIVEYSDKVAASVEKKNRYLTVRNGDRILVNGKDSFIPAIWTDGKWILYSYDGGKMSWPVPGEWENCHSLCFQELTASIAAASEPEFQVECRNGYFEIVTKPMQAFLVSKC
ncbi:MAG: endo-alpha-N-acetylgalactosaminidase family protein [Saccharofermentanales bacterium]